MAIAIYSSAVGETAPEKIDWGGAEPAAGSWARTADAMEFSYPMDAARDEPTILLRSAWQKYQVLVDGQAVGVVKDEAERKLAIRAARQVEGVKQVISYLMLPQKQADMPVPKGQVVPGAGQGTQPAATPAAAPSTEPAAQPAAQNVPTMPPANSSHKLTPPMAPPPPPVGDEAAGAV